MIAKSLCFHSAMRIHGQVKTGADAVPGGCAADQGRTTVWRLSKRLGRVIGLIACLLAVCGLAGCSGMAASDASEPHDCLRIAQARLEQTPAWDCLPTLDDQCVPLRPFFEACEALWPDCVIYAKFYLWEREVAEIISYTRRGPVSHRVRMYHSILHSCDPDYQDDERTHGDVVEFYDELGSFMGLAVYMGQGVYCPLPLTDREALPDGRR